jgi:outer membrane lipoprotein carrier protein
MGLRFLYTFPPSSASNPLVRPLLLATLLSVSAVGADRDLGTVLKAVETRYNSPKTLQVLFKEEYTATGQPHRSETGTLTLSRPNRMRWDYSHPQGKLWVSDGKQHYAYFPDENRVEVHDMKESDDLRAPLAFLLGKLHFDKEFRNLEGHSEGNGSMRITADPKTDTLPYSHVEFVVAADNSILEVKVTGFNKSMMDYHFEQEKQGVPVDPKMFQFKIPAGAEVVKVNQ